jgi:hypothetical protein
MTTADFSREVDTMVTGALNPGEQVLWMGHCLSRLGRQRKATSAAAMPEAFLAFAIAVMAAITALVITRVPVVAMVTLVVTLALAFKKTNQLFKGWGTDDAMYCRQQTAYVLTNQRAMVLRNCQTGYPVQSLLWAHADEVRAERVWPDGRGTVQFLRWDRVEQRWEYSLRFFMVGHARSVAEWAIAARDAARG